MVLLFNSVILLLAEEMKLERLSYTDDIYEFKCNDEITI